MIVFSLLLILAAVALLVLGLTGGSSTLLIASIVASLLAAIALVIGARQSAAARRAAVGPDPMHVNVDPGSADVQAARRAARRRSAEETLPASAPAGPDHAEAAAYAAGAHATEQAFAAGSSAPATSPTSPVFSAQEAEDHPVPGAEDTVPRSGGTGAQLDDDQAASFIGGARAQGDGVRERDELRADDPAEAALSGDGGGAGGGAAGAGADETLDAPAQPEPHAGVQDVAGPSEEFGEPDPDDPDDEPLPQAVRAHDAVQVARMDAEVLVVDGRPRYHLADCPHLLGRLTEPLPAAEAVELGFTPCGLCRPVDRLVAAAARL